MYKIVLYKIRKSANNTFTFSKIIVDTYYIARIKEKKKIRKTNSSEKIKKECFIYIYLQRSSFMHIVYLKIKLTLEKLIVIGI